MNPLLPTSLELLTPLYIFILWENTSLQAQPGAPSLALWKGTQINGLSCLPLALASLRLKALVLVRFLLL